MKFKCIHQRNGNCVTWKSNCHNPSGWAEWVCIAVKRRQTSLCGCAGYTCHDNMHGAHRLNKSKTTPLQSLSQTLSSFWMTEIHTTVALSGSVSLIKLKLVGSRQLKKIECGHFSEVEKRLWAFWRKDFHSPIWSNHLFSCNMLKGKLSKFKK